MQRCIVHEHYKHAQSIRELIQQYNCGNDDVQPMLKSLEKEIRTYSRLCVKLDSALWLLWLYFCVVLETECVHLIKNELNGVLSNVAHVLLKCLHLCGQTVT